MRVCMNDRLREIFLYEEIRGLGISKVKNLMDSFSSLEEAKTASNHSLAEVGLTEHQISVLRHYIITGQLADQQMDFLAKSQDYKIVTIFDDLYPENLKNIYDPPLYLFYEGKAPTKEDNYALGVVGSRKIHNLSIPLIDKICCEIAAAGFVIVSGLAMGADTVAHRAAMKSGKRTIAVLGCGIDNEHNRTVITVREKIIESGGLVYSSFPAGTTATHYTFPSRNRIISGLSLGVLVAEARAGSGSLITSNFALDQGREVFALPNHIYNEKFIGSNNLIKSGQAKLITCVQDILDELPNGLTKITSKFPEKPQRPEITFTCKEEEKIYKQIENAGQIHIDELAEAMGLQPGALLSNLMMMELRKLIRRESGNYFSLVLL